MTQRKKRWGDRWDAYRLRGLDPVHVMMPYLFGERTANEAVLGETFDLTEVDKYLAKKNAQNPEFKYTWFHFITAAVAKTIYLRPKMNYFIAGGHYYERDSIQVAFNMKRKFADEAEEAMYPKALADDDPTYSSAYLTNLGSIKMNADYHHLFNCGTVSFFVTIGEVKKIPYYLEDGTCELRNSIKLGLTIDERIADGYYFAKTLRLIRKIFQNPELLDLPAATPIEID